MPWRLHYLRKLPNFHDLIILQSQVVVLETLELRVAVGVSVRELERLVEVFALLDELDLEQVAL